MGEPQPNPIDSKVLSRIGLTGLIIAVLGIGLFLGLWIGLEGTGVNDFARLIISLCVPPALMSLAIGGWMLLIQGRR
jgi:hypothetical protein